MESIGAFLPLILIFGVFYILLIRPQQKKVKQHREMLNNLRRGDKIITSGGIIGTVNKVADNKELQVQVSENVEIKIAPGMVADLYTSSETEKKQPVKDKTSESNKTIESKGGLLSGLLGKKK
jgi:preprotein translocase subunit YajC